MESELKDLLGDLHALRDSLPDPLHQALVDEISCVGGFGSNAEMYKINGTANINAIRAASEEGIYARMLFAPSSNSLEVWERAAETELHVKYPYGGVILRPGFIYGTYRVGSMKLPLGVIGSPLEMVLQHARPLSWTPLHPSSQCHCSCQRCREGGDGSSFPTRRS